MIPQPAYVRLPRAPITTSPVPGLTSLYHKDDPGPYGNRRYPGNCGGELIKDLLQYFRPKSVFDPLTGSGTCRQVCAALGIRCMSSDLRQGFDACDPSGYPQETFDFIWLHPPYWRQKIYSDDPRDLSQTPTLDAFLERYQRLIENCTRALAPGGKLVILMGDYTDREAGFVPLTYHTKRLGFACGLKQPCTDVVRFSHGASSGRKAYRSAFIPGLHDMCIILEKPRLLYGKVAAFSVGKSEKITDHEPVAPTPGAGSPAVSPSVPEERIAILDTVDLGEGARMQLARSSRHREMQIRFIFPNQQQRPPFQATQALKHARWTWQREDQCWTKFFETEFQYRSQVEAERLFQTIAVNFQNEKAVKTESASWLGK